MSLLLEAKLAAARAVGRMARGAGRGGTSLPGKVLIRLAPDAIARLAARLGRGTVLISATNGKTTMATMTAAVLESQGVKLVHNRAGANMAGGIASALLSTRAGNGSAGALGLFEVDEFWLDRLVDQVKPRALLLGNLFRDQLDRYGELETIADRWAAAVRSHARHSSLVLNADDPLVADLGRDAPDVCYFGVDDPAMATPQMQHASDSKHCRRCGAPYTYDAIYLGHLGHYHCDNCGRRRPEPDVVASAISLQGTRAVSFSLRAPAGSIALRLPLPGLYNVYNALGAAALCLKLGISLQAVAGALAGVSAAFGRAESVDVGGVQAQILLVKNPAGANEILRTLALESDQLQLLAILNDRIADGRDISWIWDADFELLAGHLASVTCGGTRAAELALRLKYAGVPVNRIRVQPRLAEALDRALAGAREAGAARLFILPTYTALLELRRDLSARGLVGGFLETSG